MTLISRLKLWAAIAGGALLAGAALLLSVFSAGKRDERLKTLEEARKQEGQFNERIDAGHKAGNSARDNINVDADRLRVDDGHKRKPRKKSD